MDFLCVFEPVTTIQSVVFSSENVLKAAKHTFYLLCYAKYIQCIWNITKAFLLVPHFIILQPYSRIHSSPQNPWGNLSHPLL